MPDQRVVAATAVLLALTVAGCSDDRSDAPSTGGAGTGAGGTGTTGGSAAFELVATDDLSVSPDGGEVLADCWNGICRWDATDGTLELVPDRGSVAVAPDWSTVATVDDGTVVLEDLDSGETVAELTGLADDDVADGSPVTAVAYSPDGGLVAAAGTDDDGEGRLEVWSVDGAEEASFDTLGEVHRISISPEGNRIATAGNGPVEVHDLVKGESQELPSGQGGTVAWSADGARLLGVGADGQPAVWDAETWTLVAELRGTRLHEAAYAPDGGTVALTSLDGTAVTLWTPAKAAAEPRELAGHTDDPGAVAWSPDGSVLYSVSADDGVLAWDTATGERASTDFELPEGR
ncbi:WD40 repeat domain-containing protein [Nocardioides sp. T5]|uniref:WD40 repeat domain-containing protein n=1 Tax=Nocardioides sp. T5 TaxID=3400182 RepID=UPI003A8AD22B